MPKGFKKDGSYSSPNVFKKNCCPWNKEKFGYKTKPSSEEKKLKIKIALTGRKLTKEHIENLRKSHIGNKNSDKQKRIAKQRWLGKNNPNWKDGITAESMRIRKSIEYNIWRVSVFERDNYTCQRCNQRGGYLEAHHKKGFAKILQENKITTLEKALKCKELWDINNGITLCRKCHNKIRRKSR